jgi:NAD(P)-dependent dehydrogenase (short-subunit alcohol dehydrogenase family)
VTTVGIATGAGRGMGLACADRLIAMVDRLLVVDLDEGAAKAAAADLQAKGEGAAEPFPCDVTDVDALARLSTRVSELGTLRAVAHAAGISPTMADWRRIVTVDLVGTARLAEALRPLATMGTAMVCFASMAPWMMDPSTDTAAADAILDHPLDEDFLDRLHAVLGSGVEDPGSAYSWAKRGVQRFVRQEAVRLGPSGGRICAVSPGIIATPQGLQEREAHPIMDQLVEQSPVGRYGRAEEVAAVVALLLSDEASLVNGIDVLVDGGIYASIQVRTAQARPASG